MNNFLLEYYQQTHIHPYFSYFSVNILYGIFHQLHVPYNSVNWKCVLTPSNLFDSNRQIKILSIVMYLVVAYEIADIWPFLTCINSNFK